ncbi:oxidoreductase alpha (molybdopterin) subunit [Thermobifida fusca YX]|jgi:molybdopterin-dependent oxidoreductase alpha subunit|uniref:Oxidoreductase alpha (Molybdopterin) subunit n=1 Tax=Thermobifida fusca (strain YX) TaxID=269800 RepID=Q47P47_THEFY|nr:FdhF/YdeP family oxidoreductase [Thermobifida fusca]AAZ55772.1 oxidoreductase alpha (molybdopterin) subunit [Thermobifida fusca YX]MDD6790760.1 FdhF/YdeP family oxidoreductase [Thermobifida fusca]QOS58305.1 FdhF/YdeP family oxidoreductase [Thermobifida fusca]
MSRAPQEDPRQDTPAISAPTRSAAGIPAVINSLRVVSRQSGAARGLATLRDVNQKTGFDCPGCAWPEGKRRHLAEFCENGAKAVAEEATRRAVTPEFFARYSVAELATRSGYWLGQQGRLTHPVFLDKGATHYVPVSWERAFSLIAEELAALDSPDEAVFYTSGRTSNEAAFLYQLFARKFGTNNLPDCSNMCHESSGVALTETLGVGKGSVLLEDLYQADLIIVAGQNPGTNHPRMLSALEKAKRGGTRIITVNPLPEVGLMRFKNPQKARGIVGGGTRLTDLFLQIRLGGDLALFRAWNRMLVEADRDNSGSVLDREFIAEHTHGFDAFVDELCADSDEKFWADVDTATGLPREQITEALEMIQASKRIVVCWAMGLTQHKHSVPTIREVVNFLLLRGNVGRPGAGVCPVRGHSNVQGDRTVGIVEKPKEEFLDALGAEFGFEPPRHHGYDTVRAIRAMRDGKVGVFFAMGGNFVSASPDTLVTEDAMRRCRLTVHVSTKLNRSHVVTGARALILPALARTDRDLSGGKEQFVTVENSMGMVHSSRGSVRPLSDQMRSEVSIVAGLARRVFGPDDPVPWEDFARDYDLIRDRIERVIPGFANYNERARRPGGFLLPHAPRDSRRFPTATGKANFTVNRMTPLTVPEGRLLLQTLRSHDQYNTTVYGLDDRYRGVRGGRRVVLVNPEDAQRLGLADGSYTDIVSEWPDGVERRAAHYLVVYYPTAPGCAAAYYPETNVLVPLDSTAEGSNTPTSKSIVVRFEPDSGPVETG